MPEESSPAGTGFFVSALLPLFHEPARLAILSALAPAEYVDFSTLLRLTGLSKSALSKHIAVLQEKGVVAVHQIVSDKRGRRIVVTDQGRADFNAYLNTLENMVRSVRGRGGD